MLQKVIYIYETWTWNENECAKHLEKNTTTQKVKKTDFYKYFNYYPPCERNWLFIKSKFFIDLIIRLKNTSFSFEYETKIVWTVIFPIAFNFYPRKFIECRWIIKISAFQTRNSNNIRNSNRNLTDSKKLPIESAH